MQDSILVVLGATGTGKTAFAVNLAKMLKEKHSLECECINADVLQCYAGCPIVTNKATPEEQDGVPHHLLGFHDAYKDMTIQEFRKRASKLVEEMHSRNVLPIVVGGSDYYVKGLISRHFLVSEDQGGGGGGEGEGEEFAAAAAALDSAKDEIEAMDPAAAYEKLKQVDPIGAARLHPNNTRRVRRYLEIYERTGEPASKLFKKQRKDAKEQGNLLYKCCIFLLEAEAGVLGQKLGARVDDMLKRGMLAELEDLYASYEYKPQGIFKAIGVKEFADAFGREGQVASKDSREKKIEEALEEMKKNTEKLAKKQRKQMRRWLKREEISHHTIDMTSGGGVDTVTSLAATVTDFLQAPEVVARGSEEIVQWRAYHCTPCQRTLHGPQEWEEHKNSKAHRSSLKRASLSSRTETCEFLSESNTVCIKYT